MATNITSPCVTTLTSSDVPGTLLPQGLCTSYFLFPEYFYSRALLHSLDICSNVTFSGRPSPDFLFESTPSMCQHTTLIP
uniref:Uncharacterized protein n=1 Tax=Canis lupus familiaris TaxID=9615 RepID=A0A8C0SZM7_CANLF